MIDVHRDWQANGVAFDKIFQEEMIRRYGKQVPSTNDWALGNDEEAPSEDRVIIVYNEFNIEQFLAHATAGAEVHQEEDDNDSENKEDDANDADEGMQVLAL